MKVLEEIVKKTEEKVDKSAEILQSILASAAEDDGEFLVPLSVTKAAAMRAAMIERASKLDESFLSTVNAVSFIFQSLSIFNATYFSSSGLVRAPRLALLEW